MKPWSVLFVIVASLASTGCFVVTHDPALQRGVVTTTTSADLRDAGALRDKAIKRVRPSSSELNDISFDAR